MRDDHNRNFMCDGGGVTLGSVVRTESDYRLPGLRRVIWVRTIGCKLKELYLKHTDNKVPYYSI